MHVIAVPIDHVWIISHYYTSSLPTTNYSDQRSIRPTDNNKSTTTAEATVALHLQKTNTKHNNERLSARMWVARLSFNIYGMNLILYIGLFYLNHNTLRRTVASMRKKLSEVVRPPHDNDTAELYISVL